MDDVYDDTLVDFTYNFDESCTMDEPEGWNVLQTLLQNIMEVFSKLEVSIDKSYQEVSQKNSSEEKQDLSKAERLLQTLKGNWLAKCKEAENLRVALKQSTDESGRVNNEYNQMKDTILNMRKQFGDAVDSSVSDIEELSIVNSNLTERIEELEAKIEGAEKYFKKNVKGSLSSLLQSMTSSKSGGNSVPPLLKSEFEKLRRLVTVDRLFSSQLVESNTSLIQKSRNVSENASLRINECLKLEVDDARKIVDDLKSQIKDLEMEKVELLDAERILKDGCEKENYEILEYFNVIFTQYSNSSSKATVPDSSQKNMRMAKRLLGYFNINFNRLYENSTIKGNDCVDLNETISYLNEQLRSAVRRSECLEEENHILKKQYEQKEMHFKSCIEELEAMQCKIARIEEERDQFIEECIELKGERLGYNNLDNENEKLLKKIKTIGSERDKLSNELQEQKMKTKQQSSDRKELEFKCEELENTMSRIRREYTNITRELNMLTQENEDLKKSVQDSERDCVILKRNIKSIETNNKDLEDQLSHLTGQNQKSKCDYEKMRSSIQEYNTMIKELEYKVRTFEKEKIAFESELKRIKKEKFDLEELNKDLNSRLALKEEVSEKAKIILSGHEKLLIKLLHQRKEIISLIGLEHDINTNSLKVTSSLSMQYKLSSEIEENFRKNSSEIDSSFNSISSSLQSSENNWSCIEHYYEELLHAMNSQNDQDKDSCYYSTDGELTEPIQSNSCALKSKNTTRFENIQKLVHKLRGLIKHSNFVDEKLVIMKRKSKRSIKIIRQLQIRLRHQKSLENNKRSRILYLSKRLKYARAHHHNHHKKHFNGTYEYQAGDDMKTSPIRHCMSLERPYHILNELIETLANTQGMLTEAIASASKPGCELTNEDIICDFKKLKDCLSTSHDILLNKIPIDRRRRSDPSSEEPTKLALKQQKQYLMDHVQFTNKRLEVLLNCWKDKEEIKMDSKSDENDCNNNVTGNLLKRVRDSFKSDEYIMRRAVDVLELTKAISMTELDEIQEDNAIDEEHLEVIVLIKKMNENVENVLREARAQATERNNKSESTITLVGSVENIIAEPASDYPLVRKCDVNSSPSKNSLGGDTMRRESKLKMVLESTQKRVNDLSEYLKQREADLKERDEIIAKLYKEYEELKQKSNEGNEKKGSTSDRIIVEYAKAKTRLEKENEFLQLVVREVREELLSLQKGCKKEEETELQMQELIDELQMSKLSLEQSLDKMASELNIVKRDKEYLMQSLQLAGIASFYQDQCFGTPYSPAAALRNNIQRMYDNNFYPDCVYCTQNSESSILPFSDEEWVSAVSCDDCDSVISDHEHLDVVSSSDSQTTTSSKLARNIKTAEASEKIKSKNRPLRYLQKETRTRKPFLSPKKSMENTYDTSNASDTSSMTNASLVSKDSRVLGRRESNLRSRGPSFTGSKQRFSVGTSASVTSQESSASSPCSLRLTNSRSDLHSLHEAPAVEDYTWNEADVSPFLNPKFDGRKRKKKFLQFGKK